MSTLSEKERQEISLLLPWYANGTLDSKDNLRVEAALEQDEDLAREFDLVLEDQAAVIDLVSEEEVPMSMQERFKAALNAELDNAVTPATPHQAEESVISRIISALFPQKTRAYSLVAAALIVLVPTIAIFSIVIGNKQTGQYQTASGNEEINDAKTRILVKFNPVVSWTDIDAFLRENGGQVIKGPTGDGLYELEFEKVDGLAEKMGAEIGLFEFVLPST